MSTSTENRSEQPHQPTSDSPADAEKDSRDGLEHRLKASLSPNGASTQQRRTRPRRGTLLRWGIGAAVLIVLVLLPLLNIRIPGLLPGATYEPGALHLMALCMVFGSIALTYHMFLGVAGLLSFGHALYVGAGAYLLGILLAETGMGLLPAMLITLAGVIVLSLITGSVALRVSGIPFAMVTLAFAQAGSVLVRRNPGGVTGGEEGLRLNTDNIPAFLVGVDNTRNVYWMALAALLITFAVVTWIQRSRAGHLAEAVRENDRRVRVLGLQPYVAKLLIFVVGGTLAGCVGMVYLILQSGANPQAVNAEFTISILVMVVLGGVGSRWGAVVGGVIYTLLVQRMTVFAQSEAIQSMPEFVQLPLSEPLFIVGTLFVLVVLFMPGGLAGFVRRLAARGTWGRSSHEAPEDVLGQAK